MALTWARLGRLEIESNQHPLTIREIADDFLDRGRQPSDQSGNGDNLIAACQLRVAQEIDDFDPISASHVRLANLLEIAERRDRVGSVSCHVQAQFPLCGVGLSGRS